MKKIVKTTYSNLKQGHNLKITFKEKSTIAYSGESFG